MCWMGVYVLFFSLAETKLPNYILPVSAPAALLTARFLDRWRRGDVSPPAGFVKLTLALLALTGVGVAVGLLLAGGVIKVSPLGDRRLPGLEAWAVLGALPVLGAAAAWWRLRAGDRAGVVLSFTVAAVLFVGGLGANGGTPLNAHKSPKPLAQAVANAQTEHEVRVAAFAYFQPSLVFYTQREVERLNTEGEVLEFLRCPLPVYLYVPAAVWDRLAPRAPPHCRSLGRHRDFYRHCDVVAVTNRSAAGR
jgi:4-amino-4-deoxy-L-arabinose transferase-like glycosyltransferase